MFARTFARRYLTNIQKTNPAEYTVYIEKDHSQAMQFAIGTAIFWVFPATCFVFLNVICPPRARTGSEFPYATIQKVNAA